MIMDKYIPAALLILLSKDFSDSNYDVLRACIIPQFAERHSCVHSMTACVCGRAVISIGQEQRHHQVMTRALHLRMPRQYAFPAR